MQTQSLIAQRTNRMSVNAIREILKVVSQPGMTSLAGGIPAPESFPMGIIQKLSHQVIETYGSSAFQYGPTEGFAPLRQHLANRLKKKKGIQAKPENVFISSGSQGALDAVGKALISKGDKIGMESPTYLGAIQAFDPYEPDYVTLDTDEEGLIPESLEAVLNRTPLKFIYLVPTFQNPSGRTLPMERRERIAAILARYDVLLVEDDPYSDLRYDGKPLKPIKALAPDHVLYIGTMSKIFAPGLRVGYYVPPALLEDWLVIVKQGVDLHTSTFNQALAAQYLSGNHLEHHLPHIIALYKPKKDAMLKALANFFPTDFTWSKPEGGMFVWVEGPPGYDMSALYQRAIRKNVAFVPGKYFFADSQSGKETMRLNFTMADEATIEGAIHVLSKLI
ncbi:MAG: PLP-dependent aminotransferase family protein [Desulfobacterales bacterium]|nr:PLP-dependent aminotransferase family protein [Desulfobacterales bacterium]